MTNTAIALVFEQIADLLEIEGENPFKIRAYRKAVDVMRELTESLEGIAGRGELEQVEGIGKAIAEKTLEIIETGTCKLHRELTEKYPPGVLDMVNIPGLGPKKVALVVRELGLASIDELEQAAQEQRLRGLPGMGARSEEKLLGAIAGYRKRTERTPIGKVLPVARALVEGLRGCPAVAEAEAAGSLRRRRDTVKDFDFVVASTDPEATMDCFVDLPECVETLERGETKVVVRTGIGLTADLRVVQPEQYGALLMHFTGSVAHNIAMRQRANDQGLRLSEYGLFDDETGGAVELEPTEAAIYARLGLPWIPPELREDRGEIEAAEHDRLPALITAGDFRGILHAHTTWSDGAAPVAVMAETARSLGHAYLAITDHSKSLGVANGLDEERLVAQGEEVQAENAAHPEFHLLRGIEVDILADGELDLPLDLLAQLDFVVASVHSHFSQDRETMTARVVRAIQSGVVDLIAHPTGRLLGLRDPYEIDLERVFATAKEQGVALEINAFPDRLDLNDTQARSARDMGIRISVNTDAHRPEHLGALEYGVAQARRAWLEPDDVINTWPLERLRAWRAEQGR